MNDIDDRVELPFHTARELTGSESRAPRQVPIHPDVVAVNLREIDVRLAQVFPFVLALYHSRLDGDFLDELISRVGAMREHVARLEVLNALDRDEDN